VGVIDSKPLSLSSPCPYYCDLTGKCVRYAEGLIPEKETSSTTNSTLPKPPVSDTHCAKNSDCGWCNNQCLLKSLLEGLKCTTKEMPNFDCVCSNSQCQIKQKTIEELAPKGKCFKNSDCVLCNGACFPQNMIEDMKNIGIKCETKEQDKNLGCQCNTQGLCMVTISSPSSSTTSSTVTTKIPPVTSPSTCSDVYSPVCGVDNKTYNNRCELDKAGVD